MARISVYCIYVTAWILAVAAITLTAVILLSTFSAVQSASTQAQRDTGYAQVITMNCTIGGTLDRVAMQTDSVLTLFLTQTNALAAADFKPDKVVAALEPILLQALAPVAKEQSSEIDGGGVNLLYPVNTANPTAFNFTYSRSVQLWADILMNGTRQLVMSLTNSSDNLETAYEVTYAPNRSLLVGADLYTFEWFSYLSIGKLNDNFYLPAWPWASSDGNAFWYFIHQRFVESHGVQGNIMTTYVGINWLNTMLAVLAPGAELLIFDSNNMTIAATPQEELDRLLQCRENIVDISVVTTCISIDSSQHPIASIRIPFNALYEPEWANLSAPRQPFAYPVFSMNGTQYAAVTGTLVQRDLLRMTIVWYQPLVLVGDNGGAISGLICTLAILSTLVLTVLGIFGILLPLMRLGRGLRTVAANLRKGSTDVVVERHQSMFLEVDTIGKDFETIVVEFLGFSSGKTRDTTHAPTDRDAPFAVVFTDIQSSSLLWGRDPVEMARCVQSHHEIIRGLLSKHRMYEVKTVGDSFMAVGISPTSAVQFAVDLEEAFFGFEWQWPELEEVYQQSHMVLTRTKAGYAALWNGLRVRVGVHYGRGDVVFDDVTKGYDYYGPVVNIAARIENLGHGGQILASDEVLQAMRITASPGRFTTKRLGAHPLRGIKNPPVLHEVIPSKLEGRTYPPLRSKATDDVILMEEVDPNCDGAPLLADAPAAPFGERPARSGSDAASHGTGESNSIPDVEDMAARHSLVKRGVLSVPQMTQHLLLLRDMLDDVLRPLGPTAKLSTFKTICKGWGVAAPHSRSDVLGAMLVLAQRLSETTKSLVHLRTISREGPHSPSLPSAGKDAPSIHTPNFPMVFSPQP